MKIDAAKVVHRFTDTEQDHELMVLTRKTCQLRPDCNTLALSTFSISLIGWLPFMMGWGSLVGGLPSFGTADAAATQGERFCEGEGKGHC